MTLIELFPITAGLIVADVLIGWIFAHFPIRKLVWAAYLLVTLVIAIVIVGIYVMYAEVMR